MPPKKLRGMEITKAQGQDTTRKFSALGTHTPQPPSSSREGITARARAAKTTGGGVVPGEFSDKVFRLGLLFAGILHQVQDLGHGGFPKGPGDPDMEQAGQVDTAADHLVPGGYVRGRDSR